jgi:hypothetical protein
VHDLLLLSTHGFFIKAVPKGGIAAEIKIRNPNRISKQPEEIKIESLLPKPGE